jgi:hypothetical protein
VTEQEWERIIEVNGMRFEAQFVQRPFREGIEVRINTLNGIVTVAELGLGEQALLEKARSVILSEGLVPAPKE